MRTQLLKSSDIAKLLRSNILFDRVKITKGTSFYFYKNKRNGKEPLVIRVSDHLVHDKLVDLDFCKARWTLKEAKEILEEVRFRVRLQGVL